MQLCCQFELFFQKCLCYKLIIEVLVSLICDTRNSLSEHFYFFLVGLSKLSEVCVNLVLSFKV